MQKKLEQYRRADILTCDPGALADLQAVRIDPSLPRRERVDAFLRQVGNPYLFRVDGLIVKAVYPPGNLRTLAQVLPDC